MTQLRRANCRRGTGNPAAGLWPTAIAATSGHPICNQLITETTKLLARILGEDITVELRLGEGLRSTIIDPPQLEAAIANLVTNARDAMPKGGKLTIATVRRVSRC